MPKHQKRFLPTRPLPVVVIVSDMATLATPTWVLFAVSNDSSLLDAITIKHAGHRTYYEVTSFNPVVGQPVHGIETGNHVVRVESNAPVMLEPHKPGLHVVVFRGVTQHLHYTNKEDKEKLLAESRTEMEPSPSTTAVIIPIRKSPGWWALTQDQRQAFFHKTKASEGHTNIGLPFAGSVYRKLYHSRYTGSALPYDFVTYFEFPADHADDFSHLLTNLRDISKNPEWESVELEFEIRMTKVKAG